MAEGDSPLKPEAAQFETVAANEAQLILAEKRTSLAVMRTGIAVFALPLSVLSVLIATSKYYDFLKVLNLLIPLLVLCAGLLILGSYLILHAIKRMRHHDHLLREIKRKHGSLADFLD